MLEGLMWGAIGITCGVMASFAIDGARKWVEKQRKGGVVVNDGASFEQALVTRDVDHNTMPKLRVGVIEAMNGRILEVATATQMHGHNHYEWKTEMYVVPEDQKLSEAIAVVMLMKGLEK